MTTSTRTSRELEQLIAGVPASDGAGVQLQRVLTQDLQKRLDPFLMLDEFRSDNPGDYLAGFPDHPHRGFETVTYMLAGKMRHFDNKGNEGLLVSGGAQWMTAGSGLVHSELPEQEDGLMHGFQLWVNLPAQNKMIDPGYQDLTPDQLPTYTSESGAQVTVLAGVSEGVEGPVQRPDTHPLYIDVHLSEGTSHWQDIPAGHNAFVYVYEGEISTGAEGRKVGFRRMGILNNASEATGIQLTALKEAKLLIIAGQPLREPIAQWGPFVMNTHEELEQAVRDFRAGKF
ncbi:pirin family protein [Pokkaliibacter sp. CJK22405]|uniref:pirin family protein n=1 Tax=Pokkaliibacter sp. CJK22405 TaxID=3384615 RepID=UPI0039846434